MTIVLCDRCGVYQAKQRIITPFSNEPKDLCNECFDEYKKRFNEYKKYFNNFLKGIE